jgi:hypothetical protein
VRRPWGWGRCTLFRVLSAPLRLCGRMPWGWGGHPASGSLCGFAPLREKALGLGAVYPVSGSLCAPAPLRENALGLGGGTPPLVLSAALRLCVRMPWGGVAGLLTPVFWLLNSRSPAVSPSSTSARTPPRPAPCSGTAPPSPPSEDLSLLPAHTRPSGTGRTDPPSSS